MEKQETGFENKESILDIIFCKDNLVRDVVVVVIAMGLAALLVMNHQDLSYEQMDKSFSPEIGVITEEAAENEAEDPTMDTTNWKIYQTQWYGFELKYPEDWNKPALKSATRGAKWEYRYQFRKKEAAENNPHIGFDVVVYNINKIKELSNTDEFPTFKNEELKEQGICQKIEGHHAENAEYPAEQIYVSSDDVCFNPAYFYTLTRDNYIYNIVPILKGEEEKITQSEKEVIENLPEFISAASTFDLIEIKRPKPQPVAPRITAPMSVSYKIVDGKKVCAKKNDKPGKSNQGKKKHMDMQCCLDPDEYPNPHCYYDPAKYGKYL